MSRPPYCIRPILYGSQCGVQSLKVYVEPPNGDVAFGTGSVNLNEPFLILVLTDKDWVGQGDDAVLKGLAIDDDDTCASDRLAGGHIGVLVTDKQRAFGNRVAVGVPFGIPLVDGRAGGDRFEIGPNTWDIATKNPEIHIVDVIHTLDGLCGLVNCSGSSGGGRLAMGSVRFVI